ncbi:hypothetical protein BDV96DRAFT_395025 [Lophiotrema nucula]|uniref:Uncharacterized protein n=1 Tax=Lophiotrema nucula TaxID=690887 RepID=A0A6A5ZE98_9PLEO|nr:hypothetical protein BDV96DRAFT_395025 [Lophiotrema nucula]
MLQVLNGFRQSMHTRYFELLFSSGASPISSPRTQGRPASRVVAHHCICRAVAKILQHHPLNILQGTTSTHHISSPRSWHASESVVDGKHPRQGLPNITNNYETCYASLSSPQECFSKLSIGISVDEGTHCTAEILRALVSLDGWQAYGRIVHPIKVREISRQSLAECEADEHRPYSHAEFPTTSQ